jgi:hypothetical protein
MTNGPSGASTSNNEAPKSASTPQPVSQAPTAVMVPKEEKKQQQQQGNVGNFSSDEVKEYLRRGMSL